MRVVERFTGGATAPAAVTFATRDAGIGDAASAPREAASNRLNRMTHPSYHVYPIRHRHIRFSAGAAILAYAIYRLR